MSSGVVCLPLGTGKNEQDKKTAGRIGYTVCRLFCERGSLDYQLSSGSLTFVEVEINCLSCLELDGSGPAL